MNTELITALDILEKEKKISKKVLIEAIEKFFACSMQKSLWKE